MPATLHHDEVKGPLTPEKLPPEERERAEEIIAHMPDGRGPTQVERSHARLLFAALSLAALVSVVGILIMAVGSLSSMAAVLVLTLSYALGFLPLIAAVMLRHRDRLEAARMAHDGVDDRRPTRQPTVPL